MAPKKRAKVITTLRATKQEPPMLLTKEALDDLHYIEPQRSRDRIIACLNELYILAFEQQSIHRRAEH